MKWQNKLSKAELKHVRKWSGDTLAGIARTAKNQKKIRTEDGVEPCYICLGVARKLGITT